jgi:Na+-translocating ferredoxin:NAD+ oxidoreductase subunit C
MIKRSFFTLTKPGFKYDLVEAHLEKPESIPVPDNLILILNESINSAKPSLIKRGTPVKKGEKLSLYKDSSEYTISPVAGSISAIDIFIDDLGNTSTYLVIKKDENNKADTITYDLSCDLASADKYLRTLPGAPPLKKLASKNNNINTIIITCADKDLLATTSQFVASSFADEIKSGIKVLKKLTHVSKICITIPEGSDLENEFDTLETFSTSINYPSNLPALVLRDHFNIALPAGQTPEDVGVCFINAEAVLSLDKAFKTKRVNFEKHLTIIGKQGTRNRVTASIGTSLGKIFKALNIHISNEDRIVIGGPMRGSATYTLHHPVQPDMDTIMIQDKKIISQVSDNACINCGRCVQICPVNIPVNILVRYLEADQYEEAADKYDLESCIECGLCAYVCTAKIALYQYIKLGKHELSTLKTSSEEMETANE